MEQVKLNGFSADIVPLTVLIRMGYGAILRKLEPFAQEIAQEIGEDAEDIQNTMSGYAWLCPRLKNMKGKAGFEIVSSKDDPQTIKSGFMSYLLSEEYAKVNAIETALARQDSPLTPAEQQPGLETDDPN